MYRGLGRVFPIEELALSKIKGRRPRVLVLRPCCIGDVLFATALVRELHLALPQATIDFAVGPWARAMLEGNPRLNTILDCGSVGSGRFAPGDYLRLVRNIRRRGYDVAFVLARTPILTLVPFLAGIPHRVGLDSEGRGFPLTVRVPVTGHKHEAEHYLDTARAVGIPVKAPRMEFFPLESDHARAEAILRELGAPPVLIHPGGGANPGMELSAKRWPPERFAALADALAADGIPVVLVGGPSDIPLARKVLSATRSRPVNLVGRLSWGELGALAARARVYVGHDTGATHLAVAMGVPVVALFGPSDPVVYGPFGGKGVVLWHDVGCNPCFHRGRWNRDCTHFRCILSIGVDEVLEAVRKQAFERD